MTGRVAMLATAALLGGSLATVLMKAQFSLSVDGTEVCSNGTTTRCTFSKPWFGVLQMKAAMCMSLVFLVARKRYTKSLFLETPVFKRKQYGVKYLPQPRTYEERRMLLQQSVDGPSWTSLGLLVIPAALDLVQMVLSFMGLLWIPAFVYQMSSGCVVVFSACFAMRFLGLKLQRYQLVSILLMTLSMAIVAVAGVLGQDDLNPRDILNVHFQHVVTADWEQVVGMAMILLAQVIFSAQLVVEEYFLNQRHVSPLLLVGMEGLWGLVLLLPITPLLNMTPTSESPMAQLWHEDFNDTWTKLAHSGSLCLLVAAYMFCIGMYQIAALYLTKHHSALVRSMVEIGRTLGVWGWGLVVYYLVNWTGPSSPGEPLTAWSIVEIVGFLLLALATLTYKQVLHFPCLALYQDDRGLPVTVELSSFMLDRH
ncbi:Drug/Metabolite Transporter (DMT) Superfamily [Achlya hypogyna]|uniref:Drug/Metabolite Transporter (DMT) Superfamily n=1 Tax=Achlya hypogyna TaxID=1202772 RepID=A0A1V9ZMM2_ACHHY|nr:Drug/Metabolite Transporter (DMT) Superfamily [Achlya hypogyna]